MSTSNTPISPSRNQSSRGSSSGSSASRPGSKDASNQPPTPRAGPRLNVGTGPRKSPTRSINVSSSSPSNGTTTISVTSSSPSSLSSSSPEPTSARSAAAHSASSSAQSFISSHSTGGVSSSGSGGNSGNMPRHTSTLSRAGQSVVSGFSSLVGLANGVTTTGGGKPGAIVGPQQYTVSNGQLVPSISPYGQSPLSTASSAVLPPPRNAAAGARKNGWIDAGRFSWVEGD